MGFLSKVFGGVLDLFGSIFESVLGWLAPEVDVADKEGLTISRQGSDISIPVVYGTREVGGIVVDKFVTDKSGGLENELLHMLVVFSMGEVDDIEELYFDDYSQNDPRYSKKGGGKWFTVETRLGGSDNLTPVNAEGKLENFSASTSLYEGLCFAFITFEVTDKERIWRGEPQVKARIRGKKCFDWRINESLYTENPAVQLVDYIKNPICGKSVRDEDINYEYFTDVANRCDIIESSNTVTENRSYYDRELRRYINLPPITTTVDFKRFTSNTIIDTSKEVFSNIKELVNTFRGYFPEPDGRIAVASEDVSSAVYHFDADNILDGIRRKTTTKNDRFNRVVVRFPNLKNRYEKDEVFYPPQGDPLFDEWLEDDGTVLEKTLQTDTIVYKAEALQLAEVAAKVSRNSDSIEFSTTLDAAILDVGDVITVSDDTRGWDSVEFRVTYIKVRDDGVLDISAILYNETVYPWQPKVYEEDVGGIFIGDPTNIPAPENLIFNADSTLSNSGTLSWVMDSNAFLSHFEIEVSDSNENVVLEFETKAKNLNLPVVDAGDYQVDIYAVSTLGTRSLPATLTLSFTSPVSPDDLLFEESDWSIYCQPFYNSGFVGVGTSFQFDVVQGDGVGYTPSVRADGASFTATGLVPNTQYTFYVRAINAYGVSSWVSESATTTFTAQQVDPYLNTIRDELDELDLRFNDLDLDVVNISDDIIDIGDDITVIANEIEDIDSRLSASDFKFNELQRDAENLEIEFLRSFTETAASREELRLRQEQGERLIDAAVFVDPNTGTIVNRAFSYTDDAFNSASLRIDGVEGSVTLLSEQQSLIEGEVEDLNAEISLLPAQISATATAVVSEAISALEPAAVFNFFDSAQGWSAVNGTLSTSIPNEINLTLGDIENGSLDFVAEDNPIIRLSISRTGGTGWVGDLVFESDDNTTQTLTGIIEDIPTGGAISRSIDLRDVAGWNGTINRLRLVLGQSVADEFTVSQITIGAPNADQLALDDLTVRVTQAELDIDANEGEINLVSSNLEQFEGDVADSFSTANIRIDSVENEIESRAFQIVGNRVDFEEQAIEDLRDLISQSSYRSADIDEKVSYADAINKLNIDVSPQGALAESITALEAVTATIDSQVAANAQQILTVETNFTNSLAQSEQVLNARINTAESQIDANATEIARVEVDANSAISGLESVLQAQIDTNGGGISANATEISRVETDVNGAISTLESSLQSQINTNQDEISANAAEISRVETDASSARATLQTNLQAQINTNQSGVTAAFNEINRVETDASSARATLQSNLQSQINTNQDEISANAVEISRVETDASSARATLQSNLQANIDGVNSELQSTVLRVDDVEVVNGQQATAISAVQGKIDNPENNSSALYSFVQNAQATADGAVNSVTQLTNRVEDNENFADAQLQLNSEIDSSLNTLSARAFLGTNVNNRITGVIIDDDGVERVIEFAADSVRFVDGAGSAKIFYDLNSNRYVFDGEINATGGTFTGTVSSASFIGGNINIGNGAFVVNSSGDLTANRGTFGGDLSSAGGTFTGDLSAAGGTFTGDLSAVGGTFTGTLQGVDGNFTGTLFAENIEGDITDFDVITRTNDIVIAQQNTEYDVLSFRVANQKFARMLVVTIRSAATDEADPNAIPSPPSVGFLVRRNGSVLSSVIQKTNLASSRLLFPNTLSVETESTFYINVPASQSSFGSVEYKFSARALTIGGTKSAAIPVGVNEVSLVKLGSTVTNVNTF